MNTQSSMKLKKGDTVRVLRGKDRGKKGKIMKVFPQEGKVVVENVGLVTKNIRPRKQGEKGQRVHVPMALVVGNVQLVCPQCKKGTRIGIKREGDTRLRLCKQCQATFA